VGPHRFPSPIEIQAAETVLGTFAQRNGDSAGGAVLQRAARLLDVNGSGWIEEVDFHQAALRYVSGCWQMDGSSNSTGCESRKLVYQLV